MCNICEYPSRENHPNWLECMKAWRNWSRLMESIAIEQKGRIDELEAQLREARQAAPAMEASHETG